MAVDLHPSFVEQIKAMFNPATARAIVDAISHDDPVVGVRVNDDKHFSPVAGAMTVPWCPSGRVLAQRPKFTFDPHFHAGAYYVQDPSSMFIAHVIKSVVTTPVKYLDLCAAPGGKTTAALQALPQGSLVVANEIVLPRAQVLKENVVKWGSPRCMVTCDSPATLGKLEGEFDVIAADVPCSGEGMFRKDPEAVRQWTPALVEQCSARQRSILTDVWRALKPGGYLIYSTCTYNRKENDEMVDFIISSLGAQAVEIPVPKQWNIEVDSSGRGVCYRFLPHLTRGEGLTMSVLKKDGDDAQASKRREKTKRKNSGKTSVKIPDTVREWVSGDCDFVENNGVVTACPQGVKEMLKADCANLHVVKGFGVNVCEIKGHKTVPCHDLALSTMLRAGAFPEVEVDRDTAIAYLRGEALTMSDTPRGFVLLTFEGSTLGFVNNLGSRANNLYPKSWRIMSSHQPQELPRVVVSTRAAEK